MKRLALVVSLLAAMCGAAENAPGGRAATNEVAELPNVVVTASPVTQEERVSADGVETVVVSRRQRGLLQRRCRLGLLHSLSVWFSKS